MSTVNVTCRLDKEAVVFLDTLGANLDRDRSYLIKQAVSQYIQSHAWRIEEIQKGIDEADRGDFASDEDVAALFARLTREG